MSSQQLSAVFLRKTRTVAVEIDLGSRIVHIPDISLPLTFETVCQHIEAIKDGENEAEQRHPEEPKDRRTGWVSGA
jgi:hypothetical protein